MSLEDRQNWSKSTGNSFSGTWYWPCLYYRQALPVGPSEAGGLASFLLWVGVQVAGRLPKSHFQLTSFHSFFLSFFLSCLFTFPGLGWQRLWLLSRTMTVLSLSWALIAPPVNNNARMLFLAKFWPQCLVSCCLDPFHYNVEFWMLFPQTFWLLAHHVNEA